MEEYLKTLLEQIRCKKAHASIYHEIRGHIEEQVADNIAEGMSKDGGSCSDRCGDGSAPSPADGLAHNCGNRYTDTFQHFDTISRHERYSRQ